MRPVRMTVPNSRVSVATLTRQSAETPNVMQYCPTGPYAEDALIIRYV